MLLALILLISLWILTEALLKWRIEKKIGEVREEVVTMTYSCLLCGVSSERQPLVVHANLDCTEWLFLCYNCEKKVLRLTKGCDSNKSA